MVSSAVNPRVLSSDLNDLVLQVRGSNHNGQILRLRSAKCTIGSGPNCTLRLRGRGVDEVHCLILRGPNGAAVRRWSADTRLNGRTFTIAPLSAGDRLSLGRLELEVLATGEIAAAPPCCDASWPVEHQEDSTPIEPFKDFRLEFEKLDALKKEHRQAEESLDMRQKSLEETETKLRAEENELEEERRQWENLRSASLVSESRQRAEAEEQLAKLNLQQAELENQRQDLISQQRQWRTEWELAERQLQDRQRQFDDHKAGLDALAAELDALGKSLETRISLLDARDADLQTRAAELDSQRSGLDTRHKLWEESCDAREKNIALREEEADEKAARLNALQVSLSAEKENLNQQMERFRQDQETRESQRIELKPSEEVSISQETSDVEASRPAESNQSPEDSDDIRRRLVIDEEKHEETDNSAAVELSDGGIPQHDSAHEEESVDDYMARLLQRIRSVQGDILGAADDGSVKTANQPDEAQLPLGVSSIQPAMPAAESVQRGDSRDLMPHTMAPEKHDDITVLRDLAKYSAQNALGAHARWQMMRAMYSKLAVALLGGIIGLGLLFVWKMWFSNSLTFFSAMISFVVAVVWGVQYVLLTIQLLAGGSIKLDSMQSLHSENEGIIPHGEHNAIPEFTDEKATRNPELPD
jgi:hypothetical protein